MTRTIPLLALLSVVAVAQAAEAGSLYDEGTYQSIASDRRARRVGDSITVRIYETSTAEATTDTATERRQNLDANLSILGERQLGGTAAIGGTFEGGGSTQRANRLLATVTVTVREVLPSGDLRIAGEQLLTVNQEEQKVTVEGRVRPQDVSAENVVLSTRLADAQITFLGQGALSSRQRRPIWRVFLDWLGF